MIDAQVASDAPAQFLQSLREGSAARLHFRIIRRKVAPQKADTAHPLALLRASGERPRCCRAANNLHEITPSHCRPCSKATLFGIQLPSSKQKIASSETGLNAQCALQNPEQRMSQMGQGTNPLPRERANAR